MLRVYLKTPNTPGQRAFSRCAAPFFLEIRQYSYEKMSCSTQKFLAAGHIESFQIHPSFDSGGFFYSFGSSGAADDKSWRTIKPAIIMPAHGGTQDTEPGGVRRSSSRPGSFCGFKGSSVLVRTVW